ncbi:DUF445 family protein [Breznakiellaceae bacterium SP9]
MNTLFIFLIPIFVGAVIGYITNAIAIKMLFRPLKAFYLGKLRIPFTPGILPRQRHKLAESIGRMVERELFTAEIIRARLSRADVQEGMRRPIARYSEKLFCRPLNELLDSAKELELPFKGLFEHFLFSPALDALTGSLLSALAKHLQRDGSKEQSLRDILGGDFFDGLERKLEEVFSYALNAKTGPLLTLLTTELEKLYPHLCRLLVDFMGKDDIHEALEAEGRVFLKAAINKLSTMQRFLMMSAQYDVTLEQKMGQIIDDLIGQLDSLLKDSTIKTRLMALFRSSIEQFLANPASIAKLSKFAAGLAVSPSTKSLSINQAMLSQMGTRVLAYIRAQTRNPQLSILTTADQALPIQTRPSLFHVFITSFLEQNGGKTIAQLLALSADTKAALDSFICTKIISIANEQIEGVLTTINIQTLVSERIDDLDMIRVERIILDVMANQLKWINLFGAILGALMGAFQSVFSLFIR